MGIDDFYVLEMCGVMGVAFWFIGFSTLWVAAKKARPEFRVKGFLRTPSGTRWFRFLLLRQYDTFDNPSARFYFTITHYCMLGVIIVLMAACVFVGSEFLLKGVNGLPAGGIMK